MFDDVWMLSNGNILYTRMGYLAEITPNKKEVWRYDRNQAPGTNHTEVHTCQPIGLDEVMFVLNGLPPRLMVVNIKTGAVEVEHALPFRQPPNPNGIHGQYRRTRVTAQDTYLVRCSGWATSWSTTRSSRRSGATPSNRPGPHFGSRTATR